MSLGVLLLFFAACVLLFWNQCRFGHQERVYDRNAKGQYVLVCPRCKDSVVILPDQPTGPAIEQSKVTKLKLVKRA